MWLFHTQGGSIEFGKRNEGENVDKYDLSQVIKLHRNSDRSW